MLALHRNTLEIDCAPDAAATVAVELMYAEQSRANKNGFTVFWGISM